MTLETWSIDTSHSSVNLVVRHMVIAKVYGRFTRWSGTITFDEENLAATRAEVHIEAASIDTNDERRDAHLRSADFLNVERYPEIVFVAEGAQVTGVNRFESHGNLTIREKARPITLKADYLGRMRDPWGEERVAFEATAAFNRSDYDMNWNTALEAGGWLVGEEVRLTINVEAIRAASSETD